MIHHPPGRPAPPPPPAITGFTAPDAAAPAAPALRSTVPAATPFGGGPALRREDGAAAQGATFAGLGAAEAPSVVYVVDASGAMITALADVLPELERSIGGLVPPQRFGVVMFRDRPPGPGEGGRPVLYDVFTEGGAELFEATPENKEAVSRWLREIEPRGMSNPSDGLRRALQMRPGVVFLLARSIRRSGDNAQWGAGRDAMLAELDRLNPPDRRSGRRPVLIKAVQFLGEDPTGIMQAIGEVHGGGASGYTVLTREDLAR